MPRRRPQARLFARTALVAALAALVPSTGCAGKKAGAPQTELPSADARAKQGAPAGVALPDPLPLPPKPETLLHVQNPEETSRVAATWAPGRVDPNAWLAMELGWTIDKELAKTLAQSIDPMQPWDGAEWGEHKIFHLPVVAAALPGLQRSLEALPAQGGFGAVALPTSGGAPAYAWARQTAAGPRLTLASSEAALVTGVLLGETYGRAPLVGAANVSRLRLPVDPELNPVERVWAEGTIEDLVVRVALREGVDPITELELSAGAMPELLADPATLVGASSRYAGYKSAVSRVISRIQAEISDLPFLLKGLATDLAARFNAILRSWDGRVLASFAEGHVRIAYGSADPKKSGVAVLHFLRGALDGLSLVRTFTDEVPDIRLKKNVTHSGDIQVHRIDIHGARGMGKELKALLDNNGALHIAMAFDPRFAGGVVVVGPQADAQAVKWIEATNKPVGGIEGSADAAVHLALSAKQLQLLERAAMGEELDITKLWDWRADGPPVDIEVWREDATHVRLRVHGPRPTQVMKVALPNQGADEPAIAH